MKKHFLLTIVLLSVIACSKPQPEGTAEKTENKKLVKTTLIKKENLAAQIMVNANFIPKNEYAQNAPVGEVVKIFHKNGDRVKEGDIIIQLTNENTEATYKKAKADLSFAEVSLNKAKMLSKDEQLNDLESAKSNMIRAKETLDKAKRGSNRDQIDIYKADLAKSKKNYEQAKFNYDKNKDLYDDKLISGSVFLQYETAYIQTKSNLETSEKNLKIAQDGTDDEDIKIYEASYNQALTSYNLAQKNANLKTWNNSIVSAQSNYDIAKTNYELAKKAYDDLSVRAKISGVISELNIKQYAKTMDSTILFYVLDDKVMELNVGLNSTEITQINLNSKIQATVQELGKTFEGKVIEISPSADTNTNKFMVKVSIDNPDSLIKKGMYAKIIVNTAPKEAIVIPKKAIVIKGLYKYIYIKKDNIAKQIKIETGNENENYQEILSNNLTIGDKVIVEGQDLLDDNQLIEEVK